MWYLSDNDLLSLAIDAEGQMARFVAKTLKCVVESYVVFLSMFISHHQVSHRLLE